MARETGRAPGSVAAPNDNRRRRRSPGHGLLESGRRAYSDEVGGVYFDGVERAQLCDLLEALGPDAGTVLVPWTTRDLAAHLFLREHDALAGPGLVLPGAWARLAERHRQQAAKRNFFELVGAVRCGPRGVFRLGWFRRAPNLNEFFVHHEDVRRANGYRRRDLDPGLNEALWANVRSGAWFLARRLRGAGLEVCNAVTGQTTTARRGSPTAYLTGEPGELLLYLFGRQRVAEVEFGGSPVAVDTVKAAKIGL
jgi:uncharacterized protein (TIGR03085 family)